MATEIAAPASNRPRPWLLVLLLIVAMVFVYTQFFSGPAAPAGVPTTPARKPGQAAANGQVEPKDLDVRVESLTQKTPALGQMERNPFVFQPKAPTPPPPGSYTASKPAAPLGPVGPPQPPPPPPEPRIGDTVKFIGVVETVNGKIGAFSIWDPLTRECRGIPSPGKEGDILEGRYRVVRLGIESAVLEFLDGRGRATLPLNGQACVVK